MQQEPQLSESHFFKDRDQAQLAEHGISIGEATRQIEYLLSNKSYLYLERSASIAYGIMRIPAKDMVEYMARWDTYRLSSQASVCKFVPSSGAATRMFRDLHKLLNAPISQSEANIEAPQKLFFDRLASFAFFSELNETCLRNEWSTVTKLIEGGRYDLVVKSLLEPKGMNYANLPKGLILFHKYPNKKERTAAAEHLVEGAHYIKDCNGVVRIHFTVSPEHLDAFQSHINRISKVIEDEYGVIIHAEYSQQTSSSDTLALNDKQEPFRTEEGKLLFRPGGHGALIENLNNLREDIIFIKNIDNVCAEHLTCNTIRYKKLLGGILLMLRDRIYSYLRLLQRDKYTHAQLQEILTFMRETLCINFPQAELLNDKELAERIWNKLNRPIRVCGMVANDGEPGGGPFLIREADGSTSLQIVETSQIDPNDERSQTILKGSSHFNPVDIVFTPYDYQGKRFNLLEFVNERAAFITEKSYAGLSLKALERPGLWNGAMDQWNTLFVEVPQETFTPVKTINDLLRPEHQPITNLD